MKISEVIKMLEDYKHDFGDIDLYSEKDDGRSTWVSPFKPKLVRDKQQRWIVEERDY